VFTVVLSLLPAEVLLFLTEPLLFPAEPGSIAAAQTSITKIIFFI
jgi:hypothetical protein